MDNIKDIYSYVTDKVQKITSALYRVTDLLSDKEPLKWTLRDKAIGLYDELVSIKNTKDKDRLLDDSLKSFSQITKSLELISSGVCVSNRNFEILKREYSLLRDFIEGKKSDMANDPKILLEMSMFNSKKKQETNTLINNGHRNLITGINEPETNSFYGEGKQQEINPQSRKGKVLDLLKSGPAKSVNEIAINFSGEVSEKSIQRDLLDLVKMGKISAMGDKRWRKYEYAKPVDFHI
ncbi:MAG: hypothetical protein AAB924_01640 [Patescibacteria group bacterium]